MARKPASKDPMGTFARVYHEVLDSPSWAALSWSSQGLYMALRRKLYASGHNNGNIDATLTSLAQRGFTSSASLSKALRELLAVGLIAKTRNTVGVDKGSRVCCLYRFTDLECFEVPKLQIAACPPSHDWRRFKTVAEAMEAINHAEEEAKQRGQEKRARLETRAVSTRNSSRCQPASVRNSTVAKLHASKTEPCRPGRMATKEPASQSLSERPTLSAEMNFTYSNFEHLSTVAIDMERAGTEVGHV